ncbi:MAG: PilZ domain-containing protein [Pseudomonadota bacterium]
MMMSQSFNRRHSPNRRKTRVDAVMALDDTYYPVTIRDISYAGMRVRVPTEVEIEVGSPITLLFLSHRIPAIVHWYKQGFIGVHLLERLNGQTLLVLENAEDELAAFR